MKPNPEAIGERRKAVQKALTGVLNDGEAFIVFKDDDNIHVSFPLEDRGKQSRLAESKPDAYGRLVVLNHKLSAGGGWVWFFTIMFLGGICVAHQLGAFVEVLGRDWNQALDNGFAYALVMFLMFGIAPAINASVRKSRWPSLRGELYAISNEFRLDLPTILGMCVGDDKLEYVVGRLKSEADARGTGNGIDAGIYH